MASSGLRGAFALIPVVLFSSQIPATLGVRDQPFWGMYGRDATHSSRSEFSGPSRPSVLWKFEADWRLLSPPIVGPDGDVFLGTHDYVYLPPTVDGWSVGGVYRIQGSTGRLLWNFSRPSLSYVGSPALGRAGILIFPSDDDSVYALNASTGALAWNSALNETAGTRFTTAIFGPDNSAYVVATSTVQANNGLFPSSAIAIDALSGLVKWKTPIVETGTIPTLSDDGTLYFGATNGQPGDPGLIGINSTTGIIKWNYTAFQSLANIPVLGYGAIYCVTGPAIIALNESTKTLVWEMSTYGDSGYYYGAGHASIGSNGISYFPNLKGRLHAIEMKTGRVLWSYALWSTQPCIGADGTVYVTALSPARLMAFNGTTGAVKWTLLADDPNVDRVTSPVIGGDGRLYWTYHKTLVAVGEIPPSVTATASRTRSRTPSRTPSSSVTPSATPLCRLPIKTVTQLYGTNGSTPAILLS